MHGFGENYETNPLAAGGSLFKKSDRAGICHTVQISCPVGTINPMAAS